MQSGRGDLMLGYSDLREIQKREMESSALVMLSDDFYSLISQLLAKKGGDAIASKSLLAIKEYENIKKIVIAIQAKREEKIVLMALRGEREGAGLTIEERRMLKDLSEIVGKYREIVKSVWESESSAPPAGKRIKIMKEVSQYRGLDNSLYGPFRSGEEALVPIAEADWLLKAGMAELL
jgi:DNA replication initiation complex subunit (GINS family)